MAITVYEPSVDVKMGMVFTAAETQRTRYGYVSGSMTGDVAAVA